MRLGSSAHGHVSGLLKGNIAKFKLNIATVESIRLVSLSKYEDEFAKFKMLNVTLFTRGSIHQGRFSNISKGNSALL